MLDTDVCLETFKQTKILFVAERKWKQDHVIVLGSSAAMVSWLEILP